MPPSKQLEPGSGSLIIVIRPPLPMKAFTAILSAIGRYFPRSVVNTNPTISHVRVDGWLIEIGGDDAT